MMSFEAPRYPQIHVRLHSHNPFAVVSAVRLALRRGQVAAAEIDRFTEEAMGTEEPQRMHAVCAGWARVELLS